ncbi:MAG: LysR family transcriptional regulator [Hyphomicrobiaceae bacterium]
MDIQDLRIFTRVAALQNLSAVGNELGLTPGTISKRVQHLENALKVRLFDRTTRSIRMTEEGRTFLEYAERIVTELKQAQDAVGATAGRPSGRLKVSAPASLSRRLVAPALARFVAVYPEIDVRVDVTDRLVNLQEDGYDVAIRAGILSDSTLKAKRLMADRQILVAAPCYLERRGMPMRPTDLVHHHCLMLGEHRTWAFMQGGEQASIRVAGRLQSDCGSFLHQAALDGAGIVCASQFAVTDDLARGRLVQLLPEFELAGHAAVWAIYPNVKHSIPRLRVFLDHLAEFCRGASQTAADGRGHASEKLPAPRSLAPRREPRPERPRRQAATASKRA